MIRYATLPWKWVPGRPAAEAAIERVLMSWKGTRYVAGACVKGHGVDCVRFVCAALDEILGLDRAKEIEAMPPDTAMHTRDGALRVMRKLRRLYEPNRIVTDNTVSPGDIIVTGHPQGGPGHAMIAGVQPNTLWQSSAGKVHYTGLGLAADQQTVFRVYRLRSIEQW